MKIVDFRYIPPLMYMEKQSITMEELKKQVEALGLKEKQNI